MFQSALLKDKGKVIQIIKENQPIIVLISLSIVISSLSQFTQLNNSEISLITLFSIAASIYFFIALIGSILTDINKGLLFILTFYFGLILGFVFLFLVVVFLVITFLPSIFIHLLIFLVLTTTFIAVTISGLELVISLLKTERGISWKSKILGIVLELFHFLGLIVYLIGYSFLILGLFLKNDYNSIYLVLIVFSIPTIILSNSLMVLFLKMKK